MPKTAGADVQRLAAHGCVERADDRLHEVLDREELVAVRPVAEDRDPPSLANPVEEDLEHTQPLGTDERLRTDDDRVESSPSERQAEPLGVDLRLPVVPDTDERIVLVDRMVVGHAVHSSRRDQHDAPDAGLERGTQRDRCALDVDPTDRGPRHLDRKRGGGVDEHVGTRDEPPSVRGQPDVAAQLLDPTLEARILERHEVERPHVVPVGDEPTREMQAEEAGPAGDRHEHGAES